MTWGSEISSVISWMSDFDCFDIKEIWFSRNLRHSFVRIKPLDVANLNLFKFKEITLLLSSELHMNSLKHSDVSVNIYI